MVVRLVVFDLDGTLIRCRTICEVVADGLGRGDRRDCGVDLAIASITWSFGVEAMAEMLDAVGLPIFVGTERIDGLPPRNVHLPDADILEVAHVVLA